MDLVFRRRSRAIALYGLLIASLVFLVTSPARISAASESCAELREWASSYASASPTLDDLTPFTLTQRAAIFNAVTPAVRAELWREHLRRFATRSDLNDTQRAFILEARANLSAATYTGRDSKLRREQGQKLWASAEPLFPSADHRRAWFVLGEVITPSTAEGLPAATRRNSAVTLNLTQYPPCTCNRFYGWLECPSGICGGGICQIDSWGCGPEGLHECDGTCVP